MFKRLIRAIITIVGGLIGYELFELAEFIVDKTNMTEGQILTQSERAIAISFFVIIFAFIFYRYAPNLTNRSHKMANSIENEIQGVSPVEIIGGAIGLVIGNEGSGVSRLVKEKCDYVVSIPMKGDIDSLNASVAAGVLAYEVLRQRLGR